MEGTARPAGPGCGTRGRRCPWAAAGPGRASRRRTQPHTATQAPPVWRVPEGTEGTGALRDDAPSHTQRHKRRRCGGCRQDQRVAVPGCGARGRRRGLAGLVTATQAPPVWRVPEGPEGTGGLRDRPLRAVGSRVAISRAAGPDGTRNTSGTTSKTISQVARRPRAHQAARPQHAHTRTHTRAHARAHTPFRHNKTARPHWGWAAVAVALGFEPRVAVTPHSISSAAPSAARTRYLTRILYYTLPPRAQIDRACWEQGHTAA